jgi:hypothetical protein
MEAMNKADILEQINAAIAKDGGKARLKYSRVGGSFFYFEPIGKRGVPSEPLPDCSTVEELLEALNVEEVKEAMNPREDC